MFKGLCCNRRIGPSKEAAIMLEKPNNETINGGMNLRSSNGTHYLLDVTGACSYLAQNMGLQDKDNLLGINFTPTECYSHDEVLDMLKKLISGPDDSQITLVIERQDDKNDQRIIVEICFKVKREGQIFKSISKPITTTLDRYTLNIKDIQREISHKCRINYAHSNRFVTTDEDNRCITLETGRDNQISGIFTFSEYLGRSARPGRFGGVIYMATFKSANSDYYIEAVYEEGRPQLSLVSHRKPPNNDQEDARFFLLSKTDAGYSMFESLSFRGTYWTWTDPQQHQPCSLQLQRRNNDDIKKHWFTILPNSSIALNN